MTIRFGTGGNVDKLYVGTIEVSKAYLGTTEVYSSVTTPATYVTNGLVTRFAGDSGVSSSGNTVSAWVDSVGGLSAVAAGSPQIATSPGGTATVEVRSDEGLEVANPTGLPTGASARTMMLAFQPTGTQNFFGGVGYGATAADQAFTLGIDDNGNAMVDRFGAQATSIDVAGNWAIMSATYDGTNWSLWLGSTKVLEQAVTLNTGSDALNLSKGFGAFYLSSVMGEALIYDRVLSDTEISQNITHLNNRFIADSSVTTPSSISEAGTSASSLSFSLNAQITNGFLHWVVTGSASAPTVAEIVAGTGAIQSGRVDLNGSSSVSEAVTGLSADTNYYVHVVTHNLVGGVSSVRSSSAIRTAVVDTIAPTVSFTTITPTTTGATVDWSTNEANGTYYLLASTSASASVAVVKAASGASAQSGAVTASGSQTTVTLAGLSSSTTAYIHAVHTDAAGNDSAVATQSFTTATPVDATPPSISITNVTPSDSGASVTWSTNEANGTYYLLASTSASVSVAVVKAGSGSLFSTGAVTSTGAQSAVVLTGLSNSTAAYVHVVHTDAAGNDSTVTTQSFTTTGGGTQTGDVYFGAATRAGAGGYTASSFNDPSGHFTLSGGVITPTSAGVAAGLSSGPYSVTINGQARTIAIESNTLDVRSFSELQSALAHCASSRSTDWTINLREGTFLDGSSSTTNIGTVTSLFGDRRVILSGEAYSGTLSDPNAGETYASWAGNTNARASLSGGSVTIACRTQYAAGFAGQCHVYNFKGLGLKNLDFRYTTWTDQWFREEAGVAGASGSDSNSGIADATGCLTVYDGIDGTGGAQSEVLVQDCRLGGGASGASNMRYAQGLYLQRSEQVIVEDSMVWGSYQVGKIARNKKVVLRRNLFRGQNDRGIVCFVNDESGYNPIYEIYDNVMTDVTSDTNWRASHWDWIQFGVGSAEPAQYFDVYVARNRVDASAVVTYSGSNATKDTHGFVGTGGTPKPRIRGTVEYNLIILSGIEASSWRYVAASQPGSSYGLILRNNTFIKQVRFDTPAGADGNPAFPVRLNPSQDGTGRIQSVDNIYGTGLFGSGFSNESGALLARHNIQSTGNAGEDGTGRTTHPYNAVFAGPFSWNGSEGRWTASNIGSYDTSDYANAKSWLDTTFAPQGAAAGKGHLG